MACRASGVGGTAFSVSSVAFMKTMTFIPHLLVGLHSLQGRTEDCGTDNAREKYLHPVGPQRNPSSLRPDARSSAHRRGNFRSPAQSPGGPAALLPRSGYG